MLSVRVRVNIVECWNGWNQRVARDEYQCNNDLTKHTNVTATSPQKQQLLPDNGQYRGGEMEMVCHAKSKFSASANPAPKTVPCFESCILHLHATAHEPMIRWPITGSPDVRSFLHLHTLLQWSSICDRVIMHPVPVTSFAFFPIKTSPGNQCNFSSVDLVWAITIIQQVKTSWRIRWPITRGWMSATSYICILFFGDHQSGKGHYASCSGHEFLFVSKQNFSKQPVSTSWMLIQHAQ